MLKGLILVISGAAAVALQAHGIVLALWPSGAAGPWWHAPAWHLAGTVASGFFAATFAAIVTPAPQPPAADTIPGRSRHPLLAGFVHGAGMALFLPVLGPALLAFGVFLPVAFHRPRPDVQWHIVPTPSYRPEFAQRRGYASLARIRARLDGTHSPDAERLSATLALKTMPLRVSGHTLEGLLTDDAEEIRLLAYGAASNAENRLVQAVADVQARMRAGGQEAVKDGLCDLAQLHWELVYQMLARGQLRHYSLDRAKHYARSALELDNALGEMWFLLGRCALLEGDALKAEQFLTNARTCRYPENRLLPWLAEAAFMRRDFAQTRRTLDPLGSGCVIPGVQPVIHYWTS